MEKEIGAECDSRTSEIHQRADEGNQVQNKCLIQWKGKFDGNGDLVTGDALGRFRDPGEDQEKPR